MKRRACKRGPNERIETKGKFILLSRPEQKIVVYRLTRVHKTESLRKRVPEAGTRDVLRESRAPDAVWETQEMLNQ